MVGGIQRNGLLHRAPDVNLAGGVKRLARGGHGGGGRVVERLHRLGDVIRSAAVQRHQGCRQQRGGKKTAVDFQDGEFHVQFLFKLRSSSTRDSCEFHFAAPALGHYWN